MSEKILLPSENTINLQRVLWVRLIILPAVLLALWLTTKYIGMAIPLQPMLYVILFMIAVSMATLVRLYSVKKQSRVIGKNELFAQLVLDVVMLTVLLFFGGGSTNPFAPVYLLPLAMTVVALPGIYVWIMFLLTSVCYTLLLFYYVPLPMAHSHGFTVHVWGMWAGFLFSAGLFATFAARVAITVRKRDEMIAGMREQQARQQQVVALGTLAAGAAHELGTPLSTMAVLLKEMQSKDDGKNNSVRLLQDQLVRCKTILTTLSANSDGLRADSGGAEAVDVYIKSLVDDWHDMRPDTRAELNITGPAARIVVDRTLTQALLNVLNNAADASREEVLIEVDCNDEALDIRVLDRGKGLPLELIDRAGKVILSTKQEGLGVGLYLSYTTVERLGGEIRMYERDGGGTCCHIHLPLAELKVD